MFPCSAEDRTILKISSKKVSSKELQVKSDYTGATQVK
jgi:hypothetical protein